MSESARVAVVGARGIGKHHAKWWALEGAEVCAIVGTSEASLAVAETGLKELFDFRGRVYTSLDAMLAKEAPDIVDVCSPPMKHATHVRTALEAGRDVLCEKPLVFDPALPSFTLLEQARELVALADRRKKRLGLCAQYAAGAEMFARIWQELYGDERITRYVGHLASPAKGREPNPARVWVDLSPHPLSVLQRVLHGGEISWKTLRTKFDGYRASATFESRDAKAQQINCEILTENTTSAPANVRCFVFNDKVFNVEGQTDAQGIYCSRIETPDRTYTERDMMHLTIRSFLAGEPMVDGKAAVENLEWMLRVLNGRQSSAVSCQQ